MWVIESHGAQKEGFFTDTGRLPTYFRPVSNSIDSKITPDLNASETPQALAKYTSAPITQDLSDTYSISTSLFRQEFEPIRIGSAQAGRPQPLDPFTPPSTRSAVPHQIKLAAGRQMIR